MSKLFNLYKNKSIPFLVKKFSYKSIMQVPRLIKIVINICIGLSSIDKKYLDDAFFNLSLISSQRPILTYAKKSIANFKLRKGIPIGCKVTLRKKLMWNFLDKFIFISIPRIRDFRGFSKKCFDKYGNLNIGIKEQTIFPEIDYEKIKKIHGMDISININSNKIEENYALLSSFYFPFIK